MIPLFDAAALAGTRGAAVPLAVTLDLVEERGLRRDLQRPFAHAVDAGGLKLIANAPAQGLEASRFRRGRRRAARITGFCGGFIGLAPPYRPPVTPPRQQEIAGEFFDGTVAW